MMSLLQILHEQIAPNALVITIIGQMDESNVDANAPKIYELIASLPQGSALIMNFAGLEYMNSKSIGYTMDFFNKMNEKGGAYIIAEAQPQIADILNVVGLTQVIPLVSSLQEAKNMVLQGAETTLEIQAQQTQEEIIAVEPEAVPEIQGEEIASMPETPQAQTEEIQTQIEVVNESETIPEFIIETAAIQAKQEITFIETVKEKITENFEPIQQKSSVQIDIHSEIKNFRPEQKHEEETSVLETETPEKTEISEETIVEKTTKELPEFFENQSETLFSEPKAIAQETPPVSVSAPTTSTPENIKPKEEEGIPILAIAVGLAVLIIVAVLVFK